jgi:cyclophilin family peptidyl-prolyl cis-trans isomerase
MDYRKQVTDWLIIAVVSVSALFNLYYFVTLTNKELISVVKSIIEMVVPKNAMGENTMSARDVKSNNIVIKTSYGEIEVSLLTDKAPNTTANFLKLAGNGFYDGTKFHRVIKGFMIQGGDPLSEDNGKKEAWGTGGPGYKFDDELTGQETYPQGTLAMANSGPNTNGSQFFIVTASPGAPLPPSYTVFGKVVAGMDTAMKIEAVVTETNDRPVKDVIIEGMTVK